MRDYFQWFDPWDSHERQRSYGRQDVLDQIIEETFPAFQEALARRACELAADIADQFLEPRMKERVGPLVLQMNVERAMAERIRLSVAPELHSLLSEVRPALAIEDGLRPDTAVAIVSARTTLHVDRYQAFPSRAWR